MAAKGLYRQLPNGVCLLCALTDFSDGRGIHNWVQHLSRVFILLIDNT